ncbi:hypothetical protein Vi05172_g9015 [Venturia inaequalis]|nr:hypothetical protein Vi05172_g9015 [Venturia inaequalis]
MNRYRLSASEPLRARDFEEPNTHARPNKEKAPMFH